ncbi:BTAD domain-containing putative transcriptional regulator [soil metagenome]
MTAMAHLEISLLGTVQVTRGGQPTSGFGYDKVRALLAYLAVEADRPHRRETLSGLLWPDQPDDKARHSLRQALNTLRRAIGDHDARPPILLITRDMVQLNPAADVHLDVTTFGTLLDSIDACDEHGPLLCVRCLQRLEGAVRLYRGDFLAGFSLADSLEFDDWTLLKREQLRSRALDALDWLGEHHEHSGMYEQARATALRQLELDPCREEAYRRLMRVFHLRGDRAAALAQFERCRTVLAEELGVEPDAGTQALYEGIRAGTNGVRRVPHSATRFPAEVTLLIGRERELADIDALLKRDDCRLLTLTGPGGIGKTRLAIRVAATASRTYADGICFVPLAGLGSANLLASAMTDALMASFLGQTNHRQTLLSYLRDREVLIVLDNFEHLLDGVDLVEEILEQAPGIQLLVTSRQRLNVRGEWVMEVRGLTPPGEGAQAIADNDSARLFLESARRAESRFTLRPGDLESVARICRLVQGMPLALELAAAWAPVLSCAEIANEIGQSLDFLTASFRNVPDRHRSMRAVFDRSWELLADDERDAFMRLSAFRGGFRRPAAVRVAGASLSILSVLTSKSLVRRLGEDRYEIHELLRQYGEAKLKGSPSVYHATCVRHCAYYTDLLAERERALRGHEQEAALAELNDEIENVRLAWRWAVEHVEADAIIKASHGFWIFVEVTGRYIEAQSSFRAAVECLEPVASAEGNRGVAAQALAMALIREGSVYVRLGDQRRGEEILDQGIHVLRAFDVPGDMGLALNFKGMYAHARQDYQQESECLRESIDCFRAAGDRWGMAYSMNDLGMAVYLSGNPGEARRLQTESLKIFAEIGDKRGMAFALHNLGVVAGHLGEYEEARRLLDEALSIRRTIAHIWAVAETLIQTGRVSRLTGAYDDALDCLLTALRTTVDLQSLPVTLNALAELVPLVSALGERKQAVDLLATIARHPAGDSTFQDRTDRLLAELDVNLSPIVDSGPVDVWTAEVERYVHHLLAGRPALEARSPRQ